MKPGQKGSGTRYFLYGGHLDRWNAGMLAAALNTTLAFYPLKDKDILVTDEGMGPGRTRILKKYGMEPLY